MATSEPTARDREVAASLSPCRVVAFDIANTHVRCESSDGPKGTRCHSCRTADAIATALADERERADMHDTGPECCERCGRSHHRRCAELVARDERERCIAAASRCLGDRELEAVVNAIREGRR